MYTRSAVSVLPCCSDHKIMVLLIGDSGVSKTSLLQRYVVSVVYRTLGWKMGGKKGALLSLASIFTPTSQSKSSMYMCHLSSVSGGD